MPILSSLGNKSETPSQKKKKKKKKRMENPKIKLHIYNHLILDKTGKTSSGEKTFYSIDGAGITG